MNKFWHHAPRSRKTLRDFNRRRYGNPLFPRGGRKPPMRAYRRGPAPNYKRAFLSLLTVAAIAGAGWYAFFGPALAVTSIEINGAAPATEETLRAAISAYMEKKALFVFPRSHFLAFDRDEALEEIRNVVYLESLELRKKLPGSVIVDVTEKTVRAVYDADSRFYSVDESGLIVRELSGREISLLGDLPPGVAAVIVGGLGAEMVDLSQSGESSGDSGKEPAPPKTNKNPLPLILEGREKKEGEQGPAGARRAGTPTVSASTLDLILQANSRLPDITGAGVRWFTAQEDSETVDVTMAGDWHVFFSTAIPFDVQGERLSLVLKEKIGARRSDLEYVDLRYNERIFFRLKEAETKP